MTIGVDIWIYIVRYGWFGVKRYSLKRGEILMPGMNLWRPSFGCQRCESWIL